MSLIDLSVRQRIALSGTYQTMVVSVLMVLVAMWSPSRITAQSNVSPGTNEMRIVWQGTVHAGRDRRCVVKISRSDAGDLKGTFYSLDQGDKSIPFTRVVFKFPQTTFQLGAIHASFNGKMADNGRTIAGEWKQGVNALPLTLDLASQAIAWPLPRE